MTIQLGSEREFDSVWDSLTNPDGFMVELPFTIGDDDYTDKLREFEYSHQEVPISIDATIGSVVPRRLENAPCYLSAAVDGVEVPLLTGAFTNMEMNEDRSSTDFMGSSGGALLSRVRLREFVEYLGVTPDYIIKDALYRVADAGGYLKGQIRVDPLDTFILNFVNDEGFKPEESCSDLISRVVEQFPYSLRDISVGGCVAELVEPLQREDLVSYTMNAADFPKWLPPTRSENQFSGVEVYRENPDGTDAYRAFTEVVMRGLDYPFFSDIIEMIPLNDQTEDGPLNAIHLSRQRADMYSRGLYKAPQSEIQLPVFFPVIEKNDVLRVAEELKDDDGYWDRVWHLRVESFKHARDAPPGGRELSQLTTTVDQFTAILVEEDKINSPTLIVPDSTSTGVL